MSSDPNRNGILVYVSPKLGRMKAGKFWLPLPEDLAPDALYTKGARDALCIEQDQSKAIPYECTDASWGCVLADESAKRAAAEAEKKQKQEEEARILAAIANPDESEILKLSDDSHVAGLKSWRVYKVSSSTVKWNDLQAECGRRDVILHAEYNQQLRQMSDDEFLHAMKKNPHRWHLEVDVKERADEIEVARKAAEAAAKKAEVERQNAAVRAVLEKAGADVLVLERYDAGRLPVSECYDWLAEVAFAPLKGCPRYELFDADDYEHGDECDEPEVQFKTKDYDGPLDAIEWLSYKSLCAIVEDEEHLEIELRETRVYCACRSCPTSHELRRRKAVVTAIVEGIELTRDYALIAPEES
jgi:hypothetical protein